MRNQRTPVRLSFLFQKLLCGHRLETLSLTVNETFKWLSSLPIVMQESFWRWQSSDRYIISLFPLLHTPFPPSLSPSLISLMVSVDVKHHVDLLTYTKSQYPDINSYQSTDTCCEMRNSDHSVCRQICVKHIVILSLTRPLSGNHTMVC